MKLEGKAASRTTSPFDVAREMYNSPEGIYSFWKG